MSQRRSLVSPCLALIISTSFVTTSLVATTPKVTYAAYEQVLTMFWTKYLPVIETHEQAGEFKEP